MGSVTAGLERWEFWWQSRRDRFLHLRRRLDRGRAAPGSPGFLTARRGPAAGASEDLGPKRVSEELLPALLKLADDAHDSDIIDSSLVAMARSAGPDEQDAVRAALARLLPHPQRTVSAAAALSLGILGGEASRDALIPVLLNDSAGRQAVGSGSVDWFVRSFAALGLGLVGDHESGQALLDLLATLPDSERDLKASVLAALGLSEPGPRLLYRSLGELRPLLLDADLDPVLRSYVPTSLAKACGRLALPELTRVLLDDATPNAVLQSTVIALGLVARLDDAEVAEAMRDTIVSQRDEPTRHFALIALAEMGARDVERRAGAGAHAALVEQLHREVAGKGRDRGHRSWGALASAIYADAHTAARSELIESVREAFDDERDPSFRGAQALALGLMDDTHSGETILEALEKSQQDEFVGHASMALGLLRHTPAFHELSSLCADPRLQPDARLQVAMGLGLLARDDVLPVLLESLAGANSLDVLEGTANALGLVGDGRALGQLVELANDPQEPSLPRAFACVALGLLGERSELPFHVALREYNNYGAQVPAIAEMLRIL
ncbi:MAG: hypothetical protein DHS20C15_06550 [Planctomycetota bacterium]|nr:MAG: hypothetical protein DHS20C15_06550 [Planctomycetota bacterium]